MVTKVITKTIEELRDKTKNLETLLTSMGVDLTPMEKPTGFTTDVTDLKELKVAAIMDEFTIVDFRKECRISELTSENWEKEIKAADPDLLFVESAWKGKNESWRRKISGCSDELIKLCNYCKSKKIPIVFWNKEDPPWLDSFIAAAACADFVFTTDIDCIERYKRTLGHDNVYFLPFCAQPDIHNPIEKFERLDKFCFAGSYTHRYPERCRVFDAFTEVIDKGRGLDIYQRDYGHVLPTHIFPSYYNRMILGGLQPDEIDKAYKGYSFNINMNSVTDSQSMFARRVFELLASNTVCVGNFSRGIRNIFGDITISTNGAAEMDKKVRQYCKDEEAYRKYRLIGMRRVMSEHLAEDRLAFVAKCVYGKDFKKPLPEVVIVSDAKGKKATAVRRSFERQTYPNKRLVFKGKNTPKINENSFVGVMCPDDHYGDNYLTDLILSVRYSQADGFCKNRYYTCEGENIKVNGNAKTYIQAAVLTPKRGIMKAGAISDLEAFIANAEQKGDFLCMDEFNYCENTTAECPVSDDVEIRNTGIFGKDDVENVNSYAKKMNSLFMEPLMPDFRKKTDKYNTDTMAYVPYILRSGIVFVTDRYPSYGEPFESGLHKKISFLTDNGLFTDTVVMSPEGTAHTFGEYDGTDLIFADKTEMKKIIKNGNVSTLCLAFVDEDIWETAKTFSIGLKIIIGAKAGKPDLLKKIYEESADNKNVLFAFGNNEEKSEFEKQTGITTAAEKSLFDTNDFELSVNMLTEKEK